VVSLLDGGDAIHDVTPDGWSDPFHHFSAFAHKIREELDIGILRSVDPDPDPMESSYKNVSLNSRVFKTPPFQRLEEQAQPTLNGKSRVWRRTVDDELARGCVNTG